MPDGFRNLDEFVRPHLDRSALIAIGARADFVDGGELDIDALLAGALQTIGPNEACIWKPRWSAFHRTPLDSHLKTLSVDTDATSRIARAQHFSTRSNATTELS